MVSEGVWLKFSDSLREDKRYLDKFTKYTRFTEA